VPSVEILEVGVGHCVSGGALMIHPPSSYARFVSGPIVFIYLSITTMAQVFSPPVTYQSGGNEPGFVAGDIHGRKHGTWNRAIE
jgi:hypothetical protein